MSNAQACQESQMIEEKDFYRWLTHQFYKGKSCVTVSVPKRFLALRRLFPEPSQQPPALKRIGSENKWKVIKTGQIIEPEKHL